MTISADNYVSRYFAGSNITFFRNSRDGLHVVVETQRLYMRSVRNIAEDNEDHFQLFGSKDVMEKVDLGEVKTKTEVIDRIQNVWVKKWLQLDPFSAFSVFKKEGKNRVFIGHVEMDLGPKPGVCVITFLFDKKFWGGGYAKEAVKAVVNDYSRVVSQEGYLLNGEKLKTITAVTRVDNLAAIKILESVGMKCIEESGKSESARRFYAIDVESIVNNLSFSVGV